MDYVANSCQIEMDRFLELFIGTGYAEQFGAGVPKYVSGFQEGREKFKRAFSLLHLFRFQFFWFFLSLKTKEEKMKIIAFHFLSYSY